MSSLHCVVLKIILYTRYFEPSWQISKVGLRSTVYQHGRVCDVIPWMFVLNFEHILRFLTSLYVLIQTKQIRTPNILPYERSSLHPSRSIFVFTCSSFTKKKKKKNVRVLSLVTKIYISFILNKPYIIFTHPVFLCLY